MTSTTHQTITSYLKSRRGFGKKVVDLFESIHQDTSTESLDSKNEWTLLTLCHCLTSMGKYTEMNAETRQEVQGLHGTLNNYIDTYRVVG